MNDSVTTALYAVFMISTTFLMRRGGSIPGWPHEHTGVFSPLAFIFLFAALLLPLSLLAGTLGISEQQLPHDVLSLFGGVAIVVMWCAPAAFLFSPRGAKTTATRAH